MDIKLPELATDLILNIINIVILFVIVKLLVYKPVKNFLANRTSRVNEETNKAQKILDEANVTLSKKDEILEESRKKGEELAEKAYEEAKRNADDIIEEAKRSAAATKEKANEEIKTQKENLIASSKDDIASLAVDIAERILERQTSKEDNEKILKDFFSEGN